MWKVPLWMVVLGAVICVGVFSLWYFCYHSHADGIIESESNPFISAMSFRQHLRPESMFCLVLFLLGITSFNLHEIRHTPLFDKYVGNNFSGRGIVIEEPEQKNFYTQVIVRLEGDAKTQKLILQDAANSRAGYGDEISFKGKLKKPHSFVTDNGRTFDYPHYLAKDNIFYIVSSPHIEVLAHHKGSFIKSFLFGIKKSFITHVEKIIPRPESALLSGLTVAGKQLLGVTLEEKYKRAGLIHVVVLSGYNVTIAAEALVALLSFLPRLIGYSAGAIGIVLFQFLPVEVRPS